MPESKQIRVGVNGYGVIGKRVAAAVAMGLFATGVAVSILLIASHDRPFSGEIAVAPDLLRQVMPESAH